jgi:hypothetical protein
LLSKEAWNKAEKHLRRLQARILEPVAPSVYEVGSRPPVAPGIAVITQRLLVQILPAI